jgi:hypothetical protein
MLGEYADEAWFSDVILTIQVAVSHVSLGVPKIVSNSVGDIMFCLTRQTLNSSRDPRGS